MKSRSALPHLALTFLLLFSFLPAGAGLAADGAEAEEIKVTVEPKEVTMAAGQTQKFRAKVTGTEDTKVTWKVEEPDGGAIDAAGLYTAPLKPGTFHVVATSVADKEKSGKATVTVPSKKSGKGYYTGTITLDRTGTVKKAVAFDDHEEIAVTLAPMKAADVYFAGADLLAAKGQINLTYYTPDGEISDHVTTNGWKDASPAGPTNTAAWYVCMTLDREAGKMRFGIGVFAYDCISRRHGPVMKSIDCGTVAVGDLPIDLTQLSSHTVIEPDIYGAKLIVGWNLTLK